MNEECYLAAEVAEFKPDFEQAARYIETLAGENGWDARMCFQTFDDVKERRAQGGHDPLASIIEGSLLEHAETLAELNRRGAGVFVAVNQTDGEGRRNSNVTSIRAHFVDADDGDPDVSALMPSMTVQSRQGCHHYWLSTRDASLSDFKQVQRHLAAALRTDKAVSDLARSSVRPRGVGAPAGAAA